MEIAEIKLRYEMLLPFLDERLRRIVAATEVNVIGWGIFLNSCKNRKLCPC
ncbi:MAG: hypothetical protein ABH886_03215 [Candidatus Desantisbacteria bacterium]